MHLLILLHQVHYMNLWKKEEGWKMGFVKEWKENEKKDAEGTIDIIINFLIVVDWRTH